LTIVSTCKTWYTIIPRSQRAPTSFDYGVRRLRHTGGAANGVRIAGFAGRCERNPDSEGARALDIDACVAGTRRLHEFQLRLAFQQLAIDLPNTQENLKIVCRRRFARMPRYELVIGQTGVQMLGL
jgi:hypothetical protein